MKKVCCFLLVFILALSVIAAPVSATTDVAASPTRPASKIVSETVEVFPDGSKIVTIVREDISSVLPMATSYNKSGNKSITGYNSNGEAAWTFTLNGTFHVETGVSATCIDASYSSSILKSGWSLKSGSASSSGNSAFGSGTFVRKTLGITVETRDVSLTLSCDANGNLS